MRHKNKFKKRLLVFALIFAMLMTSMNFNVKAAEEPVQESAITKATNWLKANQNENGSWGNENVQSILATSKIAVLFTSLGGQDASVQKAADWLNSLEPSNFDFMTRILPYAAQEKKNELISKILSAQNIDGGWGISEGYESDILDTSLVFEALLGNDGFNEEISSAAQYLITAQNADGSWGMAAEQDGSVLATALARTALLKYKEKYRADISEVLAKSSQWLISMKNEGGLWGDEENKLYITTFVYKSLNIDYWQDVKDLPDKITLLQAEDGSWENDPYLTSLALEMLLSHDENLKIELKDIKIFSNGIETSNVNAKENVEIEPVYTGRNVNIEVYLTDPDGVRTSIISDAAGRYMWPSAMNKEGIYKAEVTIKNESGETVGSMTKDFTLLPFIQVSKAYLETTPGASIINKPVSPIVRMHVEGESNINDDVNISFEVSSPDNTTLLSKQVNARLQNGQTIIELGSFTPDTSSEGIYNISAIMSFKNSEIIKKEAKFRVLKQIGSLYTDDEDFDKGVMAGVNHDEVSDQLQLNKSAEIFPYIWIANAGEGTLSKLDTTTGKEIARYRTGPNSSTSPSRTTVDKDGNCWVGNRGNGTVLKIAMTGGIDRNNNGKIDTSSDLNGDGIIQASEMLPWGQDEAILSVTNVGSGSNSLPRALAIDKNGRIWVGLYNDRKFVVLNPDGTSANVNIPVQTSPYGACIDSDGYLWTATITNRIEKIDTNTDKFIKSYIVNGITYGIVVDKNGIVWSPSYDYYNSSVIRFDPATEKSTNHYGDGRYGRGIAVDGEGNIWAAYSGNDRIVKFDSTGKYLFTVNTYSKGRGPIGVGVDGEGNIWAVNQSTNNATKMKPDGTILGYYPVGSGPYTYSDMTGFNLKNITTHEGTWTVVHDGSEDNYKWGSINWHEKKPEGTDIIVSARAANSPEELLAKEYVQVQNGTALEGLAGRFIQVEVRLKTSNLETPVLEDIELGNSNGIPVADAGEDITVPADPSGITKVLLDGTGSYDPDGNSLTYKWSWDGGQAEGPQPEVTLSEGTTKIALVVNDGTLDSNPDYVNVTVVGPQSFKTSLATDKTEYSRDETVKISVIGKNESALSKDYKLTLDILDKDNNIVANIVKDLDVPLAGGQQQEILREWNVGATIAGSYAVRAVWMENDKSAAQDICNILVKTDGNLTNRVTTDKAEYGANEPVNITETVFNTSSNNVLKDLTVKTTITDPQGAVVWNNTEAIKEILQNDNSILKGSWDTGKSIPGNYTVTSEVYKDDLKAAQSSASFSIIESSADPAQNITGKLEVKTKNIYPADDAVIDYELTNTGNVNIEGFTARLRIVDVGTEAVIGTMEDTFSLKVNESITESKTWTHQILKTGTYMVVLDALLPGDKEIPLSSGYITVEKPYETTISQVVRPRVLVWAESQSNIDLARNTLDEMHVYYTIVNTRESFISELGTGKYNLYMLLDSKLPLTDGDDKELAAEIAKGSGIIASGDANGDNLKNLDIFGVKFTGSTTPEDFSADFPADSPFGQITLSGTGKAQDVELTGGQQFAELNSKKGSSPGVVSNQYEKGKAVLFTFDLGSCTGDTSAVLKKAVELTTPADENNYGYAELEIKVSAKAAVKAEIKLNIPQGAETIWVYPEMSQWTFDTSAGQEYTFRILLKLPQETGESTITLDSYYALIDSMFKFDSAEVKITHVQE